MRLNINKIIYKSNGKLFYNNCYYICLCYILDMIGRLYCVLFEFEFWIFFCLIFVNVVIECFLVLEKRFLFFFFWEFFFLFFVRSGWLIFFCVCVLFFVICFDVFLLCDMEVCLVYILICLFFLWRNLLMEVLMVIRLDCCLLFMYFIWLIFFLKYFIIYK